MNSHKILLSVLSIFVLLLVGCSSPATPSITPTSPATKTLLPTLTTLAPSATPSKTITPTTPPSATPTHPVLSIVPPGYSLTISGDTGIFRIKPGSNEPIRLIHTYALSLEWSPDGQWLAYGNGGQTGLFSVAQNKQIFTSNVGQGIEKWSPDGQQLAYTQYQNKISSIMIYNLQNKTDKTLFKVKQKNNDIKYYPDSPNVSSFFLGYNLDWSPDGNWIAFEILGAGPQAVFRSEVFALDMTNPAIGPRQLTDKSELVISNGAKWWDAKTLLYMTITTSCREVSISLIPMPAGGSQPLAGDFKSACGDPFYPSPNGRYIAILNHPQSGHAYIDIFDRDSGNTKTVSTAVSAKISANVLAWSPDSVYLAIPAFDGIRFLNATQNFVEAVHLPADAHKQVCPDSRPYCALAFQPQTAQTPIATLDPNSDCPGTPAARLIIGKLAQVSTVNNTPNRVRKAPEKSAAQVGVLNPGEKMMVLEGPVCSGSHRWWKVQSSVNNSLIGWTVEGDLQSYWLEPIP